MNEQKYRWLLYTIITVIVATISIQIYWNYKNYLSNKQQLINDVQGSLDKAVDDYYALLAERTTVGFAFEGDNPEELLKNGGSIDELLSEIRNNTNKFPHLDSIKTKDLKGVTILRNKGVDSLFARINRDAQKHHHDSVIKQFHFSSKLNDIKTLTSKVVISIKNDTIRLQQIDSLLNNELQRKHIDVAYSLSFKNAKDSIRHFNRLKVFNSKDGKQTLKTFSKSTFLPKNSELKVHFTNETAIILKRIIGGILVSLVLILAVIASLFYLLKIIKDQKQLAEVKNDLISNITHEFKTPIATIGVAIESIKDFNAIEDKEKTKTYLDMSNQQLSKLNVMVEKLLETATLDSDSLELNREPYNLSTLIKQLVDRHKLQLKDKTIRFNSGLEDLTVPIDVFHFENALNNVIDNAIKYGGNSISLDLMKSGSDIIITISDNGNTLTKANKDQIFEKFYRVSTGNTHDVKGFGIGLYYTKKIIEKHNGTIILDLNTNLTTFKISIPNA
ncbi:sensor histidine kinase [Seonamhaeicola marinus]|uniref:histidine kinase n=1 Tax=Seonamhaeicola marinus TaxID=1912246 RepID=A0A5D0HTW5_9FLAO|nr:HAMP domain-containing sensor histidine kinase [Seonamhaeicola marinus]TYA74736.1 HAMP domain-containing histidine kinase [Seonamhaeicola marinus]